MRRKQRHWSVFQLNTKYKYKVFSSDRFATCLKDRLKKPDVREANFLINLIELQNCNWHSKVTLKHLKRSILRNPYIVVKFLLRIGIGPLYVYKQYSSNICSSLLKACEHLSWKKSGVLKLFTGISHATNFFLHNEHFVWWWNEKFPFWYCNYLFLGGKYKLINFLS